MENLKLNWDKLNNPSKETIDARNRFFKECEELEMIINPKIGTRVYCIYGDGIFVDEVAFIGKNSFIIESFGSSTYEDSWEWYYEDYNKNWFTDLEKAKEELLSRFKDECGELKIEQVYEDYYRLEEVDE